MGLIFMLPFRVIGIAAWIRGLTEGEGGFPFDPAMFKWVVIYLAAVYISNVVFSRLQYRYDSI
jgi:hypothetical protein